MAVLGGGFSSGKREDTSKRAEFFKHVVMQVPDAIVTVIMDSGLVERINVAADLVGASLSDFLQSRFEGNIDALLHVDAGSKSHREQLAIGKTLIHRTIWIQQCSQSVTSTCSRFVT
jgi:hypothetical protein